MGVVQRWLKLKDLSYVRCHVHDHHTLQVLSYRDQSNRFDVLASLFISDTKRWAVRVCCVASLLLGVNTGFMSSATSRCQQLRTNTQLSVITSARITRGLGGLAP